MAEDKKKAKAPAKVSKFNRAVYIRQVKAT